MWWDTYQVTNPIEGLDWDSFREGFRNAHISTDIMNLKKDESRTLKQGDRTLKEYMDDFCSLSRYAPEDIDTDAKRKDMFLHGLKGELKIPPSVAYAPIYQALLDQAVTLDNNIRKEENYKRKHINDKTHTGHSHRRLHLSEGYGNGSFNDHRHNGENNGNHSNDHHSGDNGNNNGENGQHHSKPVVMKDLSTITCYKCKQKGHYADKCSENSTTRLR
jgi:hypothetical protein